MPKKKIEATKVVFVEKKTQLENNIHYLQRRLKEWKYMTYLMSGLCFGLIFFYEFVRK